MYYVVYLILGLMAIGEIKHYNNSRSFNLLYILLSVMLICRYGQGQDYFNYQQLYSEVIYLGDISPYLLATRPDLGFSILCYIFHCFNFPYIVFCTFIGIITMYWFYLFLLRYCRKSVFALFFFYSVIYLVYPFSILRQGIVLAFFAGILLPLLDERNNIKYCVYVILISTIHLSALILLLFPFVWNLRITRKCMVSIFVLLSFFSFCNVYIFSYIPIAFINERVSFYINEAPSNNFIWAKLVRFFLILPIFLFPKKWLKDDCVLLKARNMLFVGYIVYVVMAFSELAASRLWGYFLVFECIILYRILRQHSFLKLRFILLVYYFLVNATLWFKDINGFIQQGEYRNCTILSYPYISVFDDENTLYHYRTYFGNVNDIE